MGSLPHLHHKSCRLGSRRRGQPWYRAHRCSMFPPGSTCLGIPCLHSSPCSVDMTTALATALAPRPHGGTHSIRCYRDALRKRGRTSPNHIHRCIRLQYCCRCRKARGRRVAGRGGAQTPDALGAASRPSPGRASSRRSEHVRRPPRRSAEAGMLQCRVIAVQVSF